MNAVKFFQKQTYDIVYKGAVKYNCENNCEWDCIYFPRENTHVDVNRKKKDLGDILNGKLNRMSEHASTFLLPHVTFALYYMWTV